MQKDYSVFPIPNFAKREAKFNMAAMSKNAMRKAKNK